MRVSSLTATGPDVVNVSVDTSLDAGTMNVCHRYPPVALSPGHDGFVPRPSWNGVALSPDSTESVAAPLSTAAASVDHATPDSVAKMLSPTAQVLDTCSGPRGPLVHATPAVYWPAGSSPGPKTPKLNCGSPKMPPEGSLPTAWEVSRFTTGSPLLANRGLAKPPSAGTGPLDSKVRRLGSVPWGTKKVCQR